jgi:syntaxin-binding protein 5
VPSPEHGLQHDFPSPLPALTIELMSVLADASVATRLPTNFFEISRISSVRLAAESLECMITLTTGEVVVYKLTSGQDTKTRPYREAEDKELIVLEHIPRLNTTRFNPYLILASDRGPAVACDLCDVGGSLATCEHVRPF